MKITVNSQTILFFVCATICLHHTAFAENQFLKNLYKEKSGFGISSKESSAIEHAGGNATYGEITDEATTTLIQEIQPIKSDVFYDLGSGIGRMTVNFYLNSPVKKSTGIELSETRHKQATEIKQALKKQDKLVKNKTLEFRNEDILKANIDDATIAYMCSTCFSDDFMKKITDKLAKLKKGLKVLTLRRLAENSAFKLIKEFSLPMTWSSNVNVYWYELVV